MRAHEIVCMVPARPVGRTAAPPVLPPCPTACTMVANAVGEQLPASVHGESATESGSGFRGLSGPRGPSVTPMRWCNGPVRPLGEGIGTAGTPGTGAPHGGEELR